MVRTIYTDCHNSVKKMLVNTAFKRDRVGAQGSALDRSLTLLLSCHTSLKTIETGDPVSTSSLCLSISLIDNHLADASRFAREPRQSRRTSFRQE